MSRTFSSIDNKRSRNRDHVAHALCPYILIKLRHNRFQLVKTAHSFFKTRISIDVFIVIVIVIFLFRWLL